MDRSENTIFGAVPQWIPVSQPQAGGRRARRQAMLALVVCLLVLSGWLSGHDLLTRLVPGLPSMKFNTAVAFALLALSVWRTAAKVDRWPLVGAPLAMLLAAVTLLQWTSGTPLGIDNWFLRDLQTAPTEHPGRMAAATSLSVILLGCSVLMTRHLPQSLRRWRHGATLVAMAIAYGASIGLLVGVQWTGWLAIALGSVSLPTATVVLLLGCGLLGMREFSPVQITSCTALSRAGGRFVRTALPLALLLPAAIAWPMEVVVRHGQLERAEGHALATMLLGLAFGAVALAAGAWVSTLESALRANEASLTQRVSDRTSALAQAEHAAAQAHRRLAHIVQEADVGIMGADPRLAIVSTNAAAERMFGMSTTQLLGRPLASLLPADLLKPYAAGMQKLEVDSGLARRIGHSSEPLMAVRADGSEMALEVTISQEQWDGQPRCIVVLRDLTAPLALQKERLAREAAEASSRAKSVQLGHISHELRTPMNAVIGFSQLIVAQAEGTLQQTHRRWLGQIEKAGHHMLKLIADLAALSRLEAKLETLELAPVDAGLTLKEAAELLSATAADASITLALRRDPGTRFWVHADERRLRQALINLLSNAIKYSHPSSVVNAWIEPWGDDRVALRVEDFGLGMTAEQQAHLFEPFNRLGRERDAIEGTGLGLVLSRSLVVAMGGTIEVRSDIDRGSVFSILLPAAPGRSVE